MKIAGLLLAGGAGTRFGGNKLEADFAGDMLGLHAARALRAIAPAPVAVCSPVTHRLQAALTAIGYRLIVNAGTKTGMSRSLALGLAALEPADGALVVLGDMPAITTEHLRALTAAFNGREVVTSANGELRSPPAILPRRLWHDLQAQTGNHGARALLRDAISVACDPALLVDIDTLADRDRAFDSLALRR